MEETLSYLSLHGSSKIDSANDFKLLSTTHKQRNTRRAHLSRLQNCQDKPSFHPVSQQVHHLTETQVRRVCRSIKLISLRVASEDYGIPNFAHLFRPETEQDWGHEVSGLVLRYDQNVLNDSILIKLQNGLSYCRQPFLCPSSVECQVLHCMVEYTDANQEIMPESHNIWVQYAESDLNNTFQGRVLSVLV